MLNFNEVGSRKIRCGLPPRDKRSRVSFSFPLGWVPYVCCGDAVINIETYEQLEMHLKSMAVDMRTAERFCPFLDLKEMRCTHEKSAIV